MWLPSEYRASCSAVSRKTIGIGCGSGRVWICNNEPVFQKGGPSSPETSSWTADLTAGDGVNRPPVQASCMGRHTQYTQALIKGDMLYGSGDMVPEKIGIVSNQEGRN